MGLLDRFKSKPTVEELEETRDRLVVEEEVAEREASVAEKRAIIKQLKKQYGHSWKSILGLNGHLDLQTLRSVMGSMGQGLKGEGKSLRNPYLSVLPGKGTRR